jgi:hypothetical protein
VRLAVLLRAADADPGGQEPLALVEADGVDGEIGPVREVVDAPTRGDGIAGVVAHGLRPRRHGGRTL